MPQPNISVTIITMNEEDRVEKTLQSVSGWADEIVVVDACSTDGTREICRRYTDRIFEKPWEGYMEAKNYAVEKASNEWILSIDADEVVTPGLKEEILALFLKGTPSCGGYYIPRMVFYLGRWIKHSGWYPDYQMRLFSRKAGAWAGGAVHESFRLREGETSGRIKHHLEHYTYRNLKDHFSRMNRYARLWADDRFSGGKRGKISPLFYAPLAAIMKKWILKKGFLDGRHGLLIAMTSGVYVFLKYAYLLEKELTAPSRR